MASYNVEKTKKLAKHLAGIPIESKYSFGRLGATPKGIE
jgi:hypothetical protein